MSELILIAAVIILLVAGLQAAMFLMKGWLQFSGQREANDLKLAILNERLQFAAMTRNAEQKVLDHGWSGLRKFKIAKKIPEGGSISSFYFVPHDGKPLPPFQPGQYLTFSLKVEGHQRPVVRCYSLSDSALQRDYYRASVKRVSPSGAASGHFHDNLEEGDIVDVKAPSGSFYLDMSEHSPVVLIGGGVGITPVLSMLKSIVDAGSKREVWFLYGVRNRQEHIMFDELRQIDADNENVRLHICYSSPLESDNKGEDFHHDERVSVDLLKRLLPSNNYDYYMCGPSAMMSSITKELNQWGVPDNRVHIEAFGPASVKAQKQPAPEQVKDVKEPEFEVTFARSGKTVVWTNAIGSLLDLAEDNGIQLDSGCRAGSCGTCVTALKSGEVNYLDDPSGEPEVGTCLACVAAPSSTLVLDA